MASDRTYTADGTDAVDGNYERTSSVHARVLRLLYLQRGSIAARPDLGTDWASVTKMDDQLEPRLRQVILDGLDPLVRDGSISEVNVNVTIVTDYGAGYTLTYVDSTTGDAVEHSAERAWTR